jgi:PAS domain S-box-containing protein
MIDSFRTPTPALAPWAGALVRALLDTVEACLCVQGPDGRLVLVSPSFCRWVGRSEGELLGHAGSAACPEGLGGQEEDFRRALAGERLEQEERRPCGGVARGVLKAPLCAEDGTVLGVLTVFRESAAGPAPLPLNGAAKVLVGERDPNVLALTRLVLQRAGYQVTTAPAGKPALDLVRQEGRIDLVLLDQHLDGPLGPYTLLRLLAQAPDVRVLMTTSGATPELPEQARRCLSGLLRKPFSAGQLLLAVRTALARGSPKEPAVRGP